LACVPGICAPAAQPDASFRPPQLAEIAAQAAREKEADEKNKEEYVADAMERLAELDFGDFAF